eukprot:TRINITY_DN14819_c0_g1_i2.p1 TRINITY_DN14819_c0_g1~~TRINITY_DN14819_c0_g1_i2.p1  ORF type:complete len:536 (+),score=214.28 TRINITY_DN14819_c0_g1_i2:35-1609(+)
MSLNSFFSQLNLTVGEGTLEALKKDGVKHGGDAVKAGMERLKKAGMSAEDAEKVAKEGAGALKAIRKNHPMKKFGKKHKQRRPDFRNFDVVESESEDEDLHPLMGIAPRVVNRPVVTHTFSFKRVGDCEGVLAWLGMRKGHSTWSNPSRGPHPEVTITSSGPDRSLSAVADRSYISPSNFYRTKGQGCQWVAFNFESVVVCPTVYSLATGDDAFLRSWVLEASNDGIVWETLDRRLEDRTLASSVPWAAFSTPPCTKYYKYFRFKMDEKGNTSRTNELIIACLELYGSVRENRDVTDTRVELKKDMPAPPPVERVLNFCKGNAKQKFVNHGAMAYAGRNSKGGSCLDAGCRVMTNGKVVGSTRCAVEKRYTNKQLFYAEKVNKEGEKDDEGEKVWVKFVLPPNVSVSPTSYGFAHRFGNVDYYPRTWTVEGSADGESWELLKEHTNDDTINYKNKIGHWDLKPATEGSFYNQFKLTLDYHGNNRKTNTFVITCWEVYGTVRDIEGKKIKTKEKTEAPKEEEKSE